MMTQYQTFQTTSCLRDQPITHQRSVVCQDRLQEERRQQPSDLAAGFENKFVIVLDSLLDCSTNLEGILFYIMAKIKK
jgi:hypothetical protein